MDSYIFPSSACKNCDSTPFQQHERAVLRTPKADICGTCGEVLQIFPAVSSIAVDNKTIAIPPAVSETLATLLKRRLFTLGRGTQPRRVLVHKWNVEHTVATAHRIGDQFHIELRGPGSLRAALYWNYAPTNLLPPYAWEELEITATGARPRSELKPDLRFLHMCRPPRINYACDALSEFELTSYNEQHPRKSSRRLYFERRLAVSVPQLETTEEVCMVIRAELSWQQVGSSFPDHTGPREFYTGAFYQGHALTLEEAVDAAIDAAMHPASGPGRGDRSTSIYHLGNGSRELATAIDPLTRHEQAGLFGIARGATPVLRGSGSPHRFPLQFRDEGGTFLVPAGSGYKLEVSLPYPDPDDKTAWPAAQIRLLCDGRVADQFNVGGADNQHRFIETSWGVTFVGLPFVSSQKTLREGQDILVEIVNGEHVEEHFFHVVSLTRFEKAWSNWRNPLIDAYKRRLIRAIFERQSLSSCGSSTASFSSGQRVVAFIDGAWRNTSYKGDEDGSHVVLLCSRYGVEEWQVAQVKSLEQALREGLHVLPQFEASAQSGIQARFCGLS